MAEETQAVGPAKKSSKKPRSTKKRAATLATKKAEALPTEKPVPSTPQKKTSQYVVTVDNQTGIPVKIEKLDDATGKRKELTKEEYGQAMSYADPASTPETDNLVQAYYQGVADYLNALASNK